jgi:hypothetical protein
MVGIEVFTARSRRGMTFASWAVLALGSGGCVDTFKIPPARTHEVVKSGNHRQRVIWYRGQRYAIRAEQDAELRVTAWRWRARAAGGTHPADDNEPLKPVREQLAAPLGAVRAQGDTLYFPNAAPARACELESAEIELRGEPVAPLPRWDAQEGDIPLSKRKRFFGIQLGGSSFAQLIFRARAAGPLFLDVGAGAFAITHAAGGNASIGFVVDVPLARRWSVYTGAGVGAGFLFAGGGDGGSDEGGTDGDGTSDEEPESTDGENADGDSGTGTLTTRYFYGRVGLAVRIGVEQRDQLAIDGGLWRGIVRDSDVNHERAFLHPMAGFSWLRAF